jgi:homoisocitrate dehydrogenase
MSLKLCVIPGDGVGREVIPCAIEALRRVAPDLETVDADAGWECFTRVGNAFPEATQAAISACGAALFGATSSPSRKVEGYRSPILQMRQAFDLYANLRPTRCRSATPEAAWVACCSPAPARRSADRAREHRGPVCPTEYLRGDEAVAERVITHAASARIGRVALEHACQRRKRPTIVHNGQRAADLAAAYPRSRYPSSTAARRSGPARNSLT